MRKMKVISMLIVCCITMCCFSGCNNTKTKVPPTTAKTVDNINVLFIGNSLTYVGKIQEKFASLAKSANKTVKVTEKMGGSYKLFQHLADLKSGKYNDLINNADTVILQEYGGYEIDTANSVIEIQKLFKPDTKFYFLLTEFDIPKRLTELEGVQNITYIPSGYAHNILAKYVFDYKQLHSTTDYHPNDLYGYAAALTVYSVIFKTDCTGLPYDCVDASLIPGNTESEKKQSISKIQQKVMQAVKAKPEDYKKPI